MTFPILGGNGAVAGYSIDNSLRFNDGDSAYLSRTPSTPTSNDIGTFSFWFKKTNVSDLVNIVGAYDGSSSNSFDIQFHSDDRLRIRFGNTALHETSTSALFRDVSAWYHVLFAIDTTQATASNRIKIYVNGTQVTDFNATSYPAQNLDCLLLTGNLHKIGTTFNAGGNFLDGYLAEVYLIDGQALSPTDFGEFDTDSGIWKPIEYTGSYGNNGYYLDFENSGSLGADSSGNGNNFTPTNLASTDQVLDTPTNNFSTMNPLIPNPIGTNHTFSEGNLKITGATSISGYAYSTYSLTQGKWYFEFRHLAGTPRVVFGDIDGGSQQGMYFQGTGPGGYVSKMVDNSATTGVVTWSNNDIIGLAFDFDAKTFKVFHNGSEVFDETYTIDVEYFAIISDNSSVRDAEGTFNFGQDSSFAGTETRQNNSDGNGFGDFYYAPPSGYLALCTQNLATVNSYTIDDGSQHFNTAIWTGTGSAVNVDVGFQPDWVWLKSRNVVGNHRVFDSTRGATKSLKPNTTDAEATESTYLSSFNSDGFTSSVFSSSSTAVAWNWKANGGTTSSNTDGSITSTVQANTTAGFSIVTYTGNATVGATIGHGLGVAPKVVIIKNRTTATDWWMYNKNNGAGYYIELNNTQAVATTNGFNNTEPTSSVFTVYDFSVVNGSGDDMLAYCFAEIEGYSKFGSYTGNGSTDGAFVYTGFRPAFVIYKRTDSTGNWGMLDSTRSPFNVANDWFASNLSYQETIETNRDADFLSNGFKPNGTNNDVNASGGTYIYMAFAENPFVSSKGVPVTAR